MEASSTLVKKSLHRLIEEAAAAKGVAVRATSLADGRLAYVLTQYGVEPRLVTPGEAASMLGVDW